MQQDWVHSFHKQINSFHHLDSRRHLGEKDRLYNRETYMHVSHLCAVTIFFGKQLIELELKYFGFIGKNNKFINEVICPLARLKGWHNYSASGKHNRLYDCGFHCTQTNLMSWQVLSGWLHNAITTLYWLLNGWCVIMSV